MADFLIILLLSLVACWLAISVAGRLEGKRRVLERLNQRSTARNTARNPAEGIPRNVLMSAVSSRITSSSVMRDDYREIFGALKLTGRSTESIQVIYLLSCWLLPFTFLFVGIFTLGFFGGLLLIAISFIGSRRIIRSMAVHARYQQNLQSIELAQMMAMLLESGVSIERAFRIAALQARPLIPALAYRLDRFNRLMDSGANRSAALDDMSAGKDIPVLHALVRLLKQAGALGGSIGESLEQLIVESQEIERSRVKEQVNRVGAKMTVIMMVFMLPALFILIGGPAALNIVQALTR